jgi:hypothetical protein
VGGGAAPHESQRLAVAVGLRHRKVAVNVLLRVAALLVADHHVRHAVDGADARDDRVVVEARAVAVQLGKLLRDVVRDVEKRGAAWVARDLQALLRREPRVRVLPQLDGAHLELADLLRDVDAVLLRHRPHLHGRRAVTAGHALRAQQPSRSPWQPCGGRGACACRSRQASTTTQGTSGRTTMHIQLALLTQP